MTMLLLLLTTLAFGQDVFEVKEGAAETITGPAVWMGEVRFRDYVKDSRNLPVCLESLDKAITEGMEANDRALRARDIAREEFEVTDEEDAVQVQTIADLGARVDLSERQNSRLRQQRNVAWAIAGGFLAASTAAVVLSLD